MSIQYSFKNLNSCGLPKGCLDKFGCPQDQCPDFIIRRHDTKPLFRVAVADCDGPMDVTGLAVEVNMWANARLKQTIAPDCEYFGLLDDIGFNQIMVGDIIVAERVRSPEVMLVVGFDECNKLVRVARGYRNTTPDKWKKGTPLKIFRVMNAVGQTEQIFDDEKDVDGQVKQDVLQKAYLEYEWQAEDTCLPGCYWLEFKLLKPLSPPPSVIATTTDTDGGQTVDETIDLSNATANPQPTVTLIPDSCAQVSDSCAIAFSDLGLSSNDYGCMLGEGIEWIRRFPSEAEGFLIRIINTPTSENLV